MTSTFSRPSPCYRCSGCSSSCIIIIIIIHFNYHNLCLLALSFFSSPFTQLSYRSFCFRPVSLNTGSLSGANFFINHLHHHNIVLWSVRCSTRQDEPPNSGTAIKGSRNQFANHTRALLFAKPAAVALRACASPKLKALCVLPRWWPRPPTNKQIKHKTD